MQWNAEQTLSYISGLLAAEDDDNEQTTFTALSIAYEYLINSTKRKITWSLSLEKLAFQFIHLAFQTNMHASVKDIFKSYRAVTQGQYSESLKSVLEHYRDQKLEAILEEDIKVEDLPLIKKLPNIEIDEPSSEIILQSMNPENLKKQIEIKGKLRIVWQGYKSIVQTVRVNQKLEDVYMATLGKIFDFVERYNRVQEFRSFCRSLRTGLLNAFNKRERSYQEKTIYIDIEKTEVNNRNIEVRMNQFKVTTKLGLWSEAFSALEDIYTLMRVRKVPLKNSLRCQYYENLALIFSKNEFWHYQAFAYYNYYIGFLTKPKITLEERKNQADKLLLSVLVIPAVTAESQQTKQIQEKLSSMMISSTKVPSKQQLEELMVSKGVLQNTSIHIRELWNFMFLEFGVGSLKKGLQLVSHLKSQHNDFKALFQACLINKQLISIADIYQRIRIQSLERLIPLPLPQIKKMLILAHRQRTIDFTFDQAQGIIIFEDKNQLVNPTQQFHSLFIDIAITNQKRREVDSAHIMKKAQNFVENAEKQIWEIRSYKIEFFRKQLKKQLPELRKKAVQKLRAEQEKKAREEAEKKAQEMERSRLGEQARRLLAAKKIIISDIVTIKEQRTVRILQKKIENLTDEEIDNIDIETFVQHCENTKNRISNNKEAKLRKAFTYVDYFERQRRELISSNVQKTVPNQEEELNLHKKYLQTAKKHHQNHNEQRARLENLAKFYKKRVQSELSDVYCKFDKDTEDYHTRLDENFKDKVLAKAKALFEENQRKKQQQLKLKDEERRLLEWAESGGKWAFSAKRAPEPAPVVSLSKRPQNSSAPIMTRQKNTNIFENLDTGDSKEQSAPRKPQGPWSRGTKMNNEAQKKVEEVKRQQIDRPERREEKSDVKWTRGKKPEEAKPVQPVVPVVAEKKVFVPPPIAGGQKKGKWGQKVDVKKQEQKKPEVKKGKAW